MSRGQTITFKSSWRWVSLVIILLEVIGGGRSIQFPKETAVPPYDEMSGYILVEPDLTPRLAYEMLRQMEK